MVNYILVSLLAFILSFVFCEEDELSEMFVTMTNKEKRNAVANAVKSREGKNQYTNDSRRYQVDKGYSDCSSLVYWGYLNTLGINIGDDTDAQLRSSAAKDVNLSIVNGIPDESKMLVGDLLYFKGTEEWRTRYVGHVEMYVGNGQITGHGSGIGPTRKNMVDYCRSRQEQWSPVPGNNKGLICVRRVVPKDKSDDGNDPTPPTPPTPDNSLVRQGQEWLNSYYPNTIKKYCGSLLVVDGIYGTASRFASLAVWKDLINRLYGTSLDPYSSKFDSSSKSVAKYATVRSGDDGTFVFIAQFILAAKGHYHSSMDTYCGSGCVSAIKSFQSASGLSADGICGAATWEALYK